ncbi:hypothetical protein BGX38DRAFT_1166312 [Terfezia claveryi]|nr:hypothetical protein BGX38DRAFT_1166312 [Terfezia claveryi]
MYIGASLLVGTISFLNKLTQVAIWLRECALLYVCMTTFQIYAMLSVFLFSLYLCSNGIGGYTDHFMLRQTW